MGTVNDGKGTGEKDGGGEKRQGRQGEFVDGSHEWGREGSGDFEIRVVMEESGVSKSSVYAH